MITEDTLINIMQTAIDDQISDPEEVTIYELKAIQNQVTHSLDGLIESEQFREYEK